VRLAHLAGVRRLEAEATARLGGLLLDVDRPVEAEARLREALLLASEIEDRRGQALARLFLGILLWENDDPEASSMLSKAAESAVEMGLNRLEALAAAIRSRIFRETGDLASALEWSARAMSLLDRFGAELADRIAITGTRALILSTAGQADEAKSLERSVRERLKRESARMRSPLHRMRHRRVSNQLLQAVLSPVGPIYPRVPLSDGESDFADDD
jgi:tetratricopeptide (TPR) repeat protein